MSSGIRSLMDVTEAKADCLGMVESIRNGRGLVNTIVVVVVVVVVVVALHVVEDKADGADARVLIGPPCRNSTRGNMME